MAKKGPRQPLGLECSVCKSRNYISVKNKTNEQVKNHGKLILSKFCATCRKHTDHKEVTKLK